MIAKKPLSAIAARRARQAALEAQKGDRAQQTEPPTTPLSTNAQSDGPDASETHSTKSSHVKRKRKIRVSQASTKKQDRDANVSAQTRDLESEEECSSDIANKVPRSPLPHDELSEESSIGSDSASESDDGRIDIVKPINQQLTNVHDAQRIIYEPKRSCKLILKDNESVTILGQYDIWVQKGAVELLGAILHASSKLYRVYAPICNAVPTIRHAKSPFGPQQQDTVLTIYSLRSGIRKLNRLSPKFSKLWNKSDDSGRSFRILQSTFDEGKDRPVIHLQPHGDWQSLISALSNNNLPKPPTVLICGPKGAGKSTFGKYLTNALLSRKYASSGVAFLDLDPGQPEYSIPGEISLQHVNSYNLGSPFTHPFTASSASPDTRVRAHFVGSISPREDVLHYKKCAEELFSRYDRTFRRTGCPLVINCCGWIQGSGLELLEQFVAEFGPSDMVYMSKTGPSEVVEVLTEACSQGGVNLHLLNSQTASPVSRTASDFRMMQTMSYFHIDDSSSKNLYWDPTPLYLQMPRLVEFTGGDRHALGLMVLGKEWGLGDLEYLVNANTLAIVAVEDRKALPPSVYRTVSESQPRSTEDAQQSDEDGVESDVDTDEEFFAKLTQREYAEEGFSFTEWLGGSKRPAPLRRNAGSIPYLFYGNGVNIPLEPSKSRLIGQVYVRGIGPGGRLEILSPIAEQTFASLRSEGTPLVLVKGAMDAPGWSHLEAFYEAKAAVRDHSRWKKFREEHGSWMDGGGEYEEEGDEAEEEEDGPNEVDVWHAARSPWVAVTSAKKAKTKGERVWKARRNLVTGDGRRKRRRAGA